MRKSTLLLSDSEKAEPTCIFGGEHDHEGLSHEGVCPTGLTAIIVGVVFGHKHCLFPGEER